MASKLAPGYRIVSPGACPHCKSKSDWIVDAHGQIVCGCQSNERPLWDAMYQGKPLTKRQFDEHLKILAQIAGPKGWYGFGRDSSDDEHAAFMALSQSGIAKQAGTHGTKEWRLTPYGKVYARQRGIVPSNYPYPEA